MVTVGESSTLQQNLNKLSGIYWIGSMSPSRLLQSWGKVNLKSEHTHSVCTFPTIPHSWQNRALMQHSGESEHDREGEQTADRCVNIMDKNLVHVGETWQKKQKI